MRNLLLATALAVAGMGVAECWASGTGYDWWVLNFTDARCDHGVTQALKTPAESYAFLRQRGDWSVHIEPIRADNGALTYVKILRQRDTVTSYWFTSYTYCQRGLEFLRRSGDMPDLGELR